jgi:predicted deacetylase
MSMMHKVNVSIDDVSPHPQSSLNIIKNCSSLIEEFPEIKITLFVPVSYWRVIPTKKCPATVQPYQIDLYPNFCNALKELPKENFEIAYHGFHHGIPGKSNNDEFKELTMSEAEKAINAMFMIVERAGLKEFFKSYFRPPAWRLSKDAFLACASMGIELLALSTDDYAKEIYSGAEKEYKDVVYYNVAPPLKPLFLFEKTEIVYHACEWDGNYLSKSAADELKHFLCSKREQIEFVFIKGLVNGKK